MPWGELKKEDLVKAGLDPDAFKAANEKIDKAASKDDVEELKNTLKSTQDTLKSLEASLRTVSESRANSGEGDENRPKQEGNRQQNEPLTIDPLAFMEDPTGSVRKLMQESITPVTLHTLGVAADMAYNMARQRLPHFETFEPEIKEIWNKYGVHQKTKPDELIENIYNLIRGRHVDDIITDTNKREGKYNIVQSGGTSVMGNRPGADSTSKTNPEDLLTDKEREVAARFGLTPKEWAEQKSGLKYV